MYEHIGSLILFLLLVPFGKCKNDSVVQITGDSYLEAYKDSKALNSDVKIINNREYNVEPYPAANYNYGPPKPVYGPPAYPPPK